MDTALLFAQTITTGAMAGWLTTGVRDNLLYPDLNERYTAEVLDMTRMRSEYPDEFAQVAHRAISNRSIQKTAFRSIVALEVIAVVLLWAGFVSLVLALLGTVAPQTARTIALYGASAFFLIWAAMLIVGNHFSYWFCHEDAQNTHFQMTLWGLGSMILFTLGSAV